MRRSLRWLVNLPLAGLALAALGSGCTSPASHRSYSPFFRSNAYGTAGRALISRDKALLSPGQEVSWCIDNAPKRAGVVPSGQSQIGPDGTIMLGPYGTCKVAGLNEEQAGKAVATYLKDHVSGPRVTVHVLPASDLAWKSSGPIQTVAGQAAP